MSEQLSREEQRDSNPIPPFGIRGSLSPLVIVPTLIPAIGALVIPEGILDRVPVFRSFVSWVVQLLPYFGGHASSTTYPQMALLVSAGMLVAIPIIALVVLWQGWVNYPHLLHRHLGSQDRRFANYLLLPFAAGLMVVMVAVAIAVPGDPSWAVGASTNSRAFYSFLIGTLTYCTGLLLGVQVLNIRLFVDTNLRLKENK